VRGLAAQHDLVVELAELPAQRREQAAAGLRGANAAVVGVLLAALYKPVITEGVRSPADVAAALVAFGLLESWKAPPWVVVLLSAAAGQWLLR
jgi:chromate transporter